MPTTDPVKNREYCIKYYRANREKEIIKATERKLRCLEAARQLIVQSKDQQPCMDCGQRYPHYVMDFDHVRGKKIAAVSTLPSKGFSLSNIQAEIDKCDLVCANCHRERTFNSAR